MPSSPGIDTSEARGPGGDSTSRAKAAAGRPAATASVISDSATGSCAFLKTC